MDHVQRLVHGKAGAARRHAAKPEPERRGSGSRLNFKNGAGEARVHIRTQSGDVILCGKPSV
jgi:hypothetical protein